MNKNKIIYKEATMEKKKYTQAIIKVVCLKEDIITSSIEREDSFEQEDFFSKWSFLR